MALLIRLRRALVRSSSIPKCCSFSPIASDYSHLINLSKTIFPAASRLENLRPTPSKQDRRPPSTSLKNRFLFGPYYRNPKTNIPEVDFPKFPKYSPEMIETSFQTLAKAMGSVEEAKVIEEMSDKFKKSALEMIEQLKGACMREKRSVEDTKVVEKMSDKLKKSCLKIAEELKDMLGFVLVSSDLDIDRENNKFEGDKCGNEVTTPRLPSPVTEYKNQLSVEDMEMIDEMPEKLITYVEILENLKDMLGFVLVSSDLDIDRENNKFEGDKCGNEVSTPRLPSPLTEYKNQLSVEDMEMIDEMPGKLITYVEILENLKGDKCGNEVSTPRLPSPLTEYKNQLSVEDMEMIDEMPEKLITYVEILENLKDYIEKAKATRMRTESDCSRRLSEMSECIEKKHAGFKEYVEMIESHMPEESIHDKFSLEQISEYARLVSCSEGKCGHFWKSHSFDVDNFKVLVAELKASDQYIRRPHPLEHDICEALMRSVSMEGKGPHFRDLLTYRRLKRLEARPKFNSTHMPS